MHTDTTVPEKPSFPIQIRHEAAQDGAAFFIEALTKIPEFTLRGHALEAAVAALEHAADEARSDWFERRDRPEAGDLYSRFLCLADALAIGLHLLSIQSATAPFHHR